MNDRIPASLLTATVLTWNEEENIGRALSKLTWLEKVVVVDSGSTDKTIEIIHSFPNTELHIRPFDTHATQWNHTLNFCDSEWVLSMDADYILSEPFIDEIKENLNNGHYAAFYTNFDFVVFGKALKGNNTTPRAVLFRKKDCSYYDDGHTQRLQINGYAGSFKNKIAHDDRKPLSRWLYNQGNYSMKESVMLMQRSNRELPMSGKIRKTKIWGPVFIFLYCLFKKRMILNGWRGWHYTLQRTTAEILISMRLTEAQHLEKDLKDEDTPRSPIV